jgi:hypothetical protein
MPADYPSAHLAVCSLAHTHDDQRGWTRWRVDRPDDLLGVLLPVVTVGVVTASVCPRVNRLQRGSAECVHKSTDGVRVGALRSTTLAKEFVVLAAFLITFLVVWLVAAGIIVWLRVTQG